MVPRIRFLKAGHCVHPEAMVLRGGGLSPVEFGSSVAVIEHPREGVILYDTGYSPIFHEATRAFPEKLYALTTPVTIDPETTAARQLARAGIRADEVRHVVISHFHADHVAALRDFPRARLWFMDEGWRALEGLGRLAGTRRGFLRALIPDDFAARARPLRAEDFRPADHGLGEFRHAADLFGDGSVLAVPLPGHMEGHLGLLVHAVDEPYFLVGDAAWLSRSFRENRLPNPLTRLVIRDFPAYRHTLSSLHALSLERPQLRIVPCHCHEAFAHLPRLEPMAAEGGAPC